MLSCTRGRNYQVSGDTNMLETPGQEATLSNLKHSLI